MSTFYVCVISLPVSLTAEVVSSPADADLMCVADRHVRRQKVTLVMLVVQVPHPHDVAELLRSDLRTHNQAKVMQGFN